MRYFISILFLVYSTCLSAQDISVKAEIDSSRIYIGDQAVYSISITHPSGYRLRLPEISDTLYDKIEIISQRLADSSVLDNGKLFLKKEYLVTSFDTGLYQIPPYFIEIESETGIRRYYSDYVPLKVERVNITPSDSTDVIFDIIHPSKVGIGLNEVLPWILLAAFIAVLTWLAVKFWPRRKEIAEESAPIPSEPIHIIAFREFDKLEKKELWQKGRVKEYYSSLTDILRNYIYFRYSVSAQEMTTDEILYHLGRGSDSPEGSTGILKTVLENADLSKFAKYRHDETTNTAAVNMARDYVKMTYRRDEASEKSGKEIEKKGEEVSNE